MPFIRTISGLRATLSDNALNDEIVRLYARGFANILNDGAIVIGRDGRPSGADFELVIADELKKCGRNVVLLGVVPTPTVQLQVEIAQAAGGIAITASHNPSDWNGLKFINSAGVFLDENENIGMWNIIDNHLFKPYANDGSIETNDLALQQHVDKILEIPYIKSNLEKIKDIEFKVAVDAVNASGSVAVPMLLEAFGCKVLPLYCDGSGNFPHEPEPLPKNLTELAKFVKANECDLGIAVDPDADRLVLVDSHGNNVNEEMTLALAVDSVLTASKQADAKVVINLSSSMISETIAKSHNANTFRSPVGEINVVKKMKEVGAVIGGEGSGGVILPECHYGRDSLVGIALLLNLIAMKYQCLCDILLNYPKYYMSKVKQNFDGDFEVISQKVLAAFDTNSIDKSDGIRIDFENAWVQVRKSNTEPIIRIIAESNSQNRTDELIQRIVDLV